MCCVRGPPCENLVCFKHICNERHIFIYLFIYFKAHFKDFLYIVDAQKLQVLKKILLLFWMCESCGQLRKRQPTKIGTKVP